MISAHPNGSSGPIVYGERVIASARRVLDKREYVASLPALGKAYRAVMGKHYPVMTAVEVSGLVEEGARVEIEATAVVPDE